MVLNVPLICYYESFCSWLMILCLKNKNNQGNVFTIFSFLYLFQENGKDIIQF